MYKRLITSRTAICVFLIGVLNLFIVLIWTGLREQGLAVSSAEIEMLKSISGNLSQWMGIGAGVLGGRNIASNWRGNPSPGPAYEKNQG